MNLHLFYFSGEFLGRGFSFFKREINLEKKYLVFFSEMVEN